MRGRRTFSFFGRMWRRVRETKPNKKERLVDWFSSHWRSFLEKREYVYQDSKETPNVVFNFIDPEALRPYLGRKGVGTFVVGMFFGEEEESSEEVAFNHLYPVLAGSLSNVVVRISPPSGNGSNGNGKWKATFVTPERGFYFFEHVNRMSFIEGVFDRLTPIIGSQLMIDNIFVPGPEEIDFWTDNAQALEVIAAGQRLGSWGLLPVPFDLSKILDQKAQEHVDKLGVAKIIGYGNASCRVDVSGLSNPYKLAFWMSARGGKKDELAVIGQDILLVTGYDISERKMIISAHPFVNPRLLSVDGIEHALIYEQNPGVGAILHFHGWIDGIVATQQNYPCGTLELAQAVAALVRAAPDPTQAIVGLKNHGLTVTGPNFKNIFERVEGRVSIYVPMAA